MDYKKEGFGVIKWKDNVIKDNELKVKNMGEETLFIKIVIKKKGFGKMFCKRIMWIDDQTWKIFINNIQIKLKKNFLLCEILSKIVLKNETKSLKF